MYKINTKSNARVHNWLYNSLKSENTYYLRLFTMNILHTDFTVSRFG